MLLVTIRILVSVSRPGDPFVAAAFRIGGRIVLDDEIVPVRDPEISVRPDFGGNGREPLVSACEESEVILRPVPVALVFEFIHS